MKKLLIVTILSIIATFISTAIPLTHSQVWANQYMGFLLFLLLSVSVFMWDLDRWLSVFLAYCLFSGFFVAMLSARALALLIPMNLACLAIYGISKFDKKYRKYILYAIVGIIIFQSIWIALQAWNADPLFKSLINPGKNEMVGFAGSKNQLGSFYAITFPLSMYFFPPLALLSAVGLIVSRSSFAFAAAIISSIIFIWFSKRKIAVAIIVLMAIFAILFFTKIDIPRPVDFDARLHPWKKAIEVTTTGKVDIVRRGESQEVRCNPIFGYGFGNFLRIFPNIPPEAGKYFNWPGEVYFHAHNDYVELFFETGYLGISIFALMLIFFVTGYLLTPNKSRELTLYFSCIISYLLNACGNFVSQMAMSGVFLIVFCGLYYGAKREAYSGKTSVMV